MGKSVFDNSVAPKCQYCEFGISASDGKKVLCPKKGVLEPDFSCNRYRYDPLKRTPRRPSPKQEFSADDFSLT